MNDQPMNLTPGCTMCEHNAENLGVEMPKADAVEVATLRSEVEWAHGQTDAAVAELKAAEARLAEAEWLIRTDHSVGRHDNYGANLTCKGCEWLSAKAKP